MFSGICGQRRPRSACAFAQSDQGLLCPSTESLATTKCINESKGPGDTFVHAQDDLCAYCACPKALFRFTRPKLSPIGSSFLYHRSSPCSIYLDQNTNFSPFFFGGGGGGGGEGAGTLSCQAQVPSIKLSKMVSDLQFCLYYRFEAQYCHTRIIDNISPYCLIKSMAIGAKCEINRK